MLQNGVATMNVAKGNNRPQVSPAVMSERQERVADLRLHGLSVREIAKRVGVSHTTVEKDLKAVVAIWRGNATANYDAHVAQELARYDQLAAKLQPGVDRGDWKYIDQAIRLADRRARLLGVDAPIQREARVTIQAIDARIAELEAQAALPALEGEIVAEIIE